MHCFRRLSLMIAAPALAVMLSIAGCSSDKSDQPAAKKPDAGSSVGADAKSGRKASRGGEKEALVAKGWGSLKGKVTFDGDPPAVKQISIPDTVKEKDQCLQGDTREQRWKIGPDKGVADVLVWLRAPKGKYFQIPPDLQKADPSVVKLGQPNCAFVPHVFALYPSYYDPESKQQKSSGQKFEVINTANFPHNTNWSSSDPLLIAGANVIVPPKIGEQPIEVKASKDKDVGGEQQVKFNCNIHSWMSAFARVFDHPFEAVTTGDEKDAKDFGNYMIKKVPAGVEVDLVYWHESMKEPKVLKTVTLKDGENTEDISIK